MYWINPIADFQSLSRSESWLQVSQSDPTKNCTDLPPKCMLYVKLQFKLIVYNLLFIFSNCLIILPSMWLIVTILVNKLIFEFIFNRLCWAETFLMNLNWFRALKYWNATRSFLVFFSKILIFIQLLIIIFNDWSLSDVYLFLFQSSSTSYLHIDWSRSMNIPATNITNATRYWRIWS